MKSNGPKKPKQARSIATLERLLCATEELLKRKTFSDITVAEIVDSAAASTGAFYKRFSSKAELLPYLIEKRQDMHLAEIREFVADPKWRGIGLVERISLFTKILSKSYLQDRGLIRALVSRQFSDRAELPPDEIQKAHEIIDLVARWLLECVDEIRHPSPANAVKVGMFMAVTTLQSGLLFKPVSKRFGDALLVTEVTNALLAYLGVARVQCISQKHTAKTGDTQ